MCRLVIACVVGLAAVGFPGRAMAAPKADAYATAVAEGDSAAEAGDHEAALEAYRGAFLKRPVDDEVARRDLLHKIGRVEAHRFDATGDVASLRRAEGSLADAFEACGDDAPACATIRVDLEAVQAKLPPEPTAAPAPAPAPAPAVPAPSPSRPPEDVLAQQKSLKAATGVAITGAVFAGVGATAVVLLALPAWIAAEVAEDRAADDPILVSESELHRRADNRRRFARISAISGAGGLVLGGVMLGAGLGMRHRIKHRPVATAQVFPEGGGGVALAGRF